MKKPETKPDFTQKPPSTEPDESPDTTIGHRDIPIVSGPNDNQGGN